MTPPDPTALYIHWPFCRKKCPYCDFNSHVRVEIDHTAWKSALLTEMRWMAEHADVSHISSIFFGGGTPSLMPEEIAEALINETYRLWSCATDLEITLEANPTSSEAKRFKGYRDAGVNRLSLGVQSLIDEELAFLGREHSADEALAVLEMTASLFERYSFDLIYARPHQTVERWEQELGKALTYASGHLSLYQLTIEPDTPFERVYAKGGFTLPDDDTAADLYDCTRHLCADAGLYAYEISNYADKGQESQHNLTYWRGGSYIGIGPGAHGRIMDRSSIWHATSTIKSPERWLYSVQHQRHGLEVMEALTHHHRAEEILLSGLRLKEGIARNKVEQAINPDQRTRLKECGLIDYNDQHIWITQQGALLTERIIAELLI